MDIQILSDVLRPVQTPWKLLSWDDMSQAPAKEGKVCTLEYPLAPSKIKFL
jgi:hypothetical protein